MQLNFKDSSTGSGNILIIGDEEFFHWCLAQELAALGYTVSHASDLEDGDKALAKTDAQLIIYDRDFTPKTSLRLFSEWLKTHSNAKTILLTAATPPHPKLLSFAAADVCLCKPFEMKELLTHVELAFTHFARPK